MSCEGCTSDIPGEAAAGKGLAAVAGFAPGPLPAPRRAEESGPQFPQFLYLGAATHSRSASRPASPAFSVRGLRASCRLTQLRCWVAPSPEVSSPASGPAHFLRSRSSVQLRCGHARPLFLHTSAGVNPARSVAGVREAARWAAGAASVRRSQPHPAPEGLCKAAYAAVNGFLCSGKWAVPSQAGEAVCQPHNAGLCRGLGA